VQTTEVTKVWEQAEATQLLGQTPFLAPDKQAPSLPEERCLPRRALTTRACDRAFLCPMSLGDQSAQVRVWTTEATQLLGLIPFWAPVTQATSPPEKRCLPRKALTTRPGERAIFCPASLREQSAKVSTQTAEATHLLGQALFRAFIFSQEAGLNARPLCTFPARGEHACRENSDH
jgi:hypothetical protein